MATTVGQRLAALRAEHDLTLAALSEMTGISKSTLSRLETDQRKPTLELLLPLSRTYQVTLDDLVGAPEVGDPRVAMKPRQLDHGRVGIPLTRSIGPLQAWKMIITDPELHEPRVHEGYEWFYVLSGRIRMRLGDKEIVLRAGEVAEFDCRQPHSFSSADGRPAEIISLFGKQGERIHTRAAPPNRS
ncbi:helix-turn-helix domain-containing protein [Lentzea albidocapillata]|uniref:DNA-binding transcriptional regulator, XRE-family HTH domain n=1 Tax=Lentzea albidocapillata TaxID=40571 RepID=A0A1W2FB76_9PSEU|nr:helix-turn-helix domain-containing protein [Lentzea albidocapillata]SMD19123.1 DNA-binding transcriptional regulator, XRE-family HTH domain [Lentzea albidocapillata]